MCLTICSSNLQFTSSADNVKLPKDGRGAIKISDANPKSDLDWTIHRSKQIPGPNQYKPKDIRPDSGVKFSDSFPKSDLDWSIHRAKALPGPSAYNIDYCPPPASSAYLLD